MPLKKHRDVLKEDAAKQEKEIQVLKRGLVWKKHLSQELYFASKETNSTGVVNELYYFGLRQLTLLYLLLVNILDNLRLL